MTALLNYQRANNAATVQALRAAMATIETDIMAAPDGVYPHNKGRVTLAEICRRANLARSTPNNPHHAAIKAEMTAWLKDLGKRKPTKRRDAVEHQRETLAELRAGFAELCADVQIFRHRASELEEQCARKDAEIRRLTQLLQEARRLAGPGATVVPLGAR